MTSQVETHDMIWKLENQPFEAHTQCLMQILTRTLLWTLNLFWFALALNCSTELNAAPRKIRLAELIRNSDQLSPALKAGQLKRLESRKSLESAQSQYFPELSAAMIAADGDPGASSVLGLDQNVSARNRKGYGAGLILKHSLYDFGRTSNQVAAAKAASSAAIASTEMDRSRLHLKLVEDFTACAIETQKETALEALVKEASLVARETEHFVRTGQKSLVELYLFQAQERELETSKIESQVKEKSDLERLSIWSPMETGSDWRCPDLSDAQEQVSELQEPSLQSSEKSSLDRQIEFLNFKSRAAKAEELPLLTLNANGAWFHNSELDQRWIYSVGVGLSFPLYDGNRRSHEVERSLAKMEIAQAELDQNNQDYRLLENQFNNDLTVLKARQAELQEENQLAKKTYDLAKSRYLQLKGNLLDFRESLKNLLRVQMSSIDTGGALLRTEAEKKMRIDSSQSKNQAAFE